MGLQIKTSRSNGEGGSGQAGLVGKLLVTGFLSIFVAAGIFFGNQIGDKIDAGIAQESWAERPCTIIDSGIKIKAGNEDPYEAWVRYTYQHGGKTYTGSTIATDFQGTSDYRDAQQYVLDFPKGSAAKAYVNPDVPSDAVLETGGAKSALMGVFAVVFVALFSGIPLLIILNLWRPGKKGKRKKDKRAKAARARGKGDKSGRIVGTIFGGVFACAGLGMLIGMTILPLYRTAKAQGWKQTSAVVERSAVLRHDGGDDGPTYSIDILYKYEVSGQVYGSNRYSFGRFGSSSGQSGKRKIVKQYPVGKEIACYVDPADPTCATIERGLTLANLWGLFPLPFLLIGLAVMYASLFGKEKHKGKNWLPGSKTAAEDTAQGSIVAGVQDTGPAVLDPGKSRVGKFIGMVFFALIWNGLIATIGYFFVLQDYFADKGLDTVPAIVLGVFQLIGLFIIGGALRSLMLLFAPKVILELGRRTIPVGGSTTLKWSVGGGRVDRVTIKLIGMESATYRRGTDTVTDTDTFFEQVLAGGNEDGNRDGDETAFETIDHSNDRGEIVLQIPSETMHSFESDNNKILWKLEVHADVPNWPDPKDKYDITVLPMAIAGGSRG